MPRLAFLFCCAFVVAGCMAAASEQSTAAPVLQAQGGVPGKAPEAGESSKLQAAAEEPVKPQEPAKPKEQPAKGEETTAKGEETTPAKTTKPVEPTTETTTVTPAPTTTPAPPTTSAAPATTTAAPSPTPVPAPSQGKWMVNATGKVCIVLQMAAQFHISYNVTENKTLSMVLDLPGANGSTQASGVCGENEQNLTISWTPRDNSSLDQFVLHFVKNETTKHYSLEHLELQLAASTFPAANLSTPLLLSHNESSFATGLSNSYRCIKQQKLGLKGASVTGHIVLSDLQFQAFRSENSTVFGLAKDCAYDVPDVVPIAVGCALAGLVVIILIAYLVSRRRSQARGYLSM